VVDWTAVTAIGTVLAGLALPLAFVQLDAQRRERLRAQVSKIGGWTQVYGVFKDHELLVPQNMIAASTPDGYPTGWKVSLSLRNGSELPVVVNRVEMYVRRGGPELLNDRTLAGLMPYASKRSRETEKPFQLFIGETFEPESTRESTPMPWPLPGGSFDRSFPPKVSINLIVVTDAAGHLWEVRPTRGRPPKLVHWWRRRAIL
jgi:hypothetical protein